ncbi:tryptophan synthase subunit beta [Halodurantibacterium flavum]|uniref:Tryptophan synthase subunit beta n=1 Tax=Halodurantibacterium flavum TaxID=1382802 RepID=A0ABW4S612_9RHOB
MTRDQRRFQRQVDAMMRRYPRMGQRINPMMGRKQRLWRIPLAIFFIIGGFLAVLPIFGLWMLPLGVLLLAVDVPVLQPPASRGMIWLRRRLRRSDGHGVQKR